MTLLGEVSPCGSMERFASDITEMFIYSGFVGSVGLAYILYIAFSACYQVNYIAGFASVFYTCVVSTCVATGVL